MSNNNYTKKTMEQMSLKQEYAKCCEDYLKLFCGMMDYQYEPDSWVGGEPGTIAACGDYFFDFHDVIKYCVDNSICDGSDLLEWYDYTLWASDMGVTIPNYRSWHMGCPRTSREKQEELNALKRSLMDAIEEEKRKQ